MPHEATRNTASFSRLWKKNVNFGQLLICITFPNHFNIFREKGTRHLNQWEPITGNNWETVWDFYKNSSSHSASGPTYSFVTDTNLFEIKHNQNARGCIWLMFSLFSHVQAKVRESCRLSVISDSFNNGGSVIEWKVTRVQRVLLIIYLEKLILLVVYSFNAERFP